MAAFNKFNDFSEQVLRGTHDFATDTFKIMLTASAPAAADEVKADISEIAAGGGYPAGGQPITCTLSRAVGVAKVVIADETFTGASGGTFAAFRYGVVYNDSAGSKNLVGWFDHGASISLGTGDTFICDFDSANGAFTLA